MERNAREGFVAELELLNGLRFFALAEVRGLTGVRVLRQDEEALEVNTDDLATLLSLRGVVAAYLVTRFEVPRPKALLGDEHFRRLLGAVETIRALHPADTFGSFRVNAAGSDSAVYQRLAAQLGAATRLVYSPDEGDLLLRVRPGDTGWEVLTRLSPRPLSARAWRVCNLPGGLNATVAAAMNGLARPTPADRYLNAMCGSGTLLVERALAGVGVGAGARLVGCDLDAAALACAAQNVRAAGLGDVQLVRADATALPFADNSFDTLTADLPWGDAVGSHASNAALYPTFLAEAARVAARGARLVVLTHEVKLFERVLAGQSAWALERELRVFHGGHRPRLCLLKPRRS